MFMEPFSYQAFETTLLAEVAAGRVPVARVDDAVRRILAKKFEPVRAPFTDGPTSPRSARRPTAPWPAAPSPSPRCC